MRPTQMLLHAVLIAGVLACIPAAEAANARGLRFDIQPNAVQGVLTADAELQYTSFQPGRGLAVIDLHDCVSSELEPVYQVDSPLLRMVKVSSTPTGSSWATRLEFHLGESASLTVTPQGDSLALHVTAPVAAAGGDGEASRPAVLTDIEHRPGDNGTELLLRGHGLGDYRRFRLSDPFRLVLDFNGVRSRVPRPVIHVNDDLVQQVRLSQFRTDGDGTVRVVLDLTKDVRDVDIDTVPEGLRVRLGGTMTLASETAPAPSPARRTIPVEVSASAPTRPAPSAAVPTSVDDSAPERTDSAFVRLEAPVITPRAIAPPMARAAEPVTLAPATASRSRRGGPSPIALLQDEMEGEIQYSGEPITLDLVNADIIDFFRLISDLEGLNIIVDPSVSGTISLKLDNVPWDQVFDLALKNNRLAKVIEGNVVRIATMDAFKAEEKAREELKQAREITTDIVKVNYARAEELKDKLESLLTKSGEIKIDERTNTLVVRDIPERIADIRRLAQALDSPEHQVDIEARIISASRNFARSIGIQVGFVAGNFKKVTVGGTNTFAGLSGYRPTHTPASAYAAGNPLTGRGASQDKPADGGAISVGTEGNNRRGNYNWSLPASGATSGIGISVGNILDTFLLDASLTAAESNGLVRIISQPKVQAQNNKPAIIEQGLQFPVQVVENNTVSVRFFSASLKLEVQPQITDEGTVLLKITIENNRADFVNTVNGIPSIVTSMSSTEVLVADGGTTVIGGILIDQDRSNIDRVPLFGDIPLLGHLFKRNTKAKESQEILFFLTPRIVR